MKLNWKKVAKATAVFVFGTLIAVIANKNKDEFDDWLESASDGELSDGYEQRRQEWARTGYGGNGEKTPEMKKIDSEISRRSAATWESNPHRNTDPNFRWTDANRWEKD